eukprot:3045316-Pyramimonas_sp.AAC.1
MEFWDDELPVQSPPEKKCRVAASHVDAFPEGLGGQSDVAHAKACRAKSCSRCTWINNKDSWTKKCGPWLAARLDVDQKTFGVGCLWCSDGLKSKGVQSIGLM